MLTRKSILVSVLLIATVVGVLRLANLGKAASQAPAADECRLFSCIFDDDADDD